MPVAGRGGVAGERDAVSAGARDTESVRSGAVGVTMCSGGRIDGQKSRSKKAGTSMRRLYAGASRGRTVTTCGVGTWPRISIVSWRRGGRRCSG
jgi:hypothetical protein